MFHVRTKAALFFLLLLPHSVISIFPWDSAAGLVLEFLYGNNLPNMTNGFDSQMFMTTGDLIEYHGYPFENHQVTTEDGYILELHRIPNRKLFNASPKRISVIMVPGLLGDSGCFVASGEFRSPGFILSNSGYDVWLHNNRGTRYARKHTHLNPDLHRKYWNYSFHEMGVYDLSATIDYILSATNAKQVYMIGHSMGGAAISIFITERMTYNSKVKGVFLLSPAIGLEQTLVPLAHTPTFSEILLLLFDEMEILPFNNNTLFVVTTSCISPTLRPICELVSKTDFSSNKNSTIGARILGGTCVKVLRHFLQMANKNYFSKYDYGMQRNMEMYGQETAPAYPLEITTVPVFVFHADNDMLVISSDIINVSQNFGNLKEIIHVTDESFGHLDYLLSSTAKALVYDKIVDRMSMLSSSEQATVFVVDLSYLLLDTTLVLLMVLLIVLFVAYHMKSKVKSSSK